MDNVESHAKYSSEISTFVQRKFNELSLGVSFHEFLNEYLRRRENQMFDGDVFDILESLVDHDAFVEFISGHKGQEHDLDATDFLHINTLGN
jgi:hypothetical protein